MNYCVYIQPGNILNFIWLVELFPPPPKTMLDDMQWKRGTRNKSSNLGSGDPNIVLGGGGGLGTGQQKRKLSLLPGGSISDEKPDVYVIPRTADSRSPSQFSAFSFCSLCYFIQGDSVFPTTTDSRAPWHFSALPCCFL